MPWPAALTTLLLLAPATTTDTPESTCDSVALCNERGTAAYQSGRMADAQRAFERQIDYADSAIEDLEQAGQPVPAGHQNARQLALNNAALAYLKEGACLKARAFLRLADASHRATQTNLRQLQRKCGAQLEADSQTGDYWQYAGHGAFSTLTLRPGADGGLLLDANWLRITRGPIDSTGAIAFGGFEQLPLSPNGQRATGSYAGSEGIRCEIVLAFVGQAIEITGSENDDCNQWGAGGQLSGRYILVDPKPSTPAR